MSVNNLTTLHLPRQLAARQLIQAASYCLLTTLLMASSGLATAATGYQSHESIEQAARDYLLRLRDASEQVEIQTGRLDPRLQLTVCDKSLQTFLPPGGKTIGRTTVGVRCTGSKPWSLYVSANVKVFKQIVVSKQPLSRGQLITNSNIQLQRRDIGTLMRPYLTNAQQVIGKVLKRNVQNGAPIDTTMVEAPLLVRRGQYVTLIAEASGLQVRMAGKSLGNGTAGDRIRVRNTLSKRIVEGQVTEAGIVKVDM